MNEKIVEKLYKKYKTPLKKIKHMKCVAKLSLIIADMLDVKVDKKLLKYSALLHDLTNNRKIKFFNNFDLIWSHQISVKEALIKERYPLIADTASRHNSHGLTIKESKKWGHKKGIDLLPNSIESKIISFADGLRKDCMIGNDSITITDDFYRKVLEKYGMVKIAENRRKKIFNYLVKHGMNYKKVLELIE